MNNSIRNMIHVLLVMALFTAIYNFIIVSRDVRLSDKIARNVDILSKRYEKRMLKLRYRQYYKAKSREKNIIQYLDIKIEKSNIRRFIPFLTAETLLIICTASAIPAFIYAYHILYNVVAGFLLACFSFVVPVILVNLFAYNNASKVDRQLVFYINILKNFCHIQDNIVFAIERSIPYLNEPLSNFNLIFLNEVRHGITPFDALENYKNKIDNSKFRLLIKNLQLCLKYKGSYVEVLTKSKEQMKKYSIEKSRRKAEVRKGKYAIFAMILISVILFYGIVMINPYILIALRTYPAGQLIVVYNIAVILFAVYKSITLEKFVY